MGVIFKLPIRFWSLLFCIPALLAPSLAEAYTSIIFWVGILIFGIPHGAIDHHINLRDKHSNSIELIFFVIKYLGWMLLFLSVWLVSSTTAILFFIAISAWHFGMVDFSHPVSKFERLLAFSYGFLLLSVILVSHQSEVSAILLQLGLTNEQVFQFERIDSGIASILLVGLAVIVFVSGKPDLIWTIFLLGIGSFLPLLLVFSLYFSFQHSFQSISETRNYLGVKMIKLLKMAMPFSLAAYFIGFALFTFLAKSSIKLDQIIPFLFLFLGMITLPHIIYYRFENH